MKNKKGNAFTNKTSGLINYNDMQHTRYKFLYVAMFTFMVIVSIVCLLPIIWIALSSFKTPAEMYSLTPSLLPNLESISFDKVIDVWGKIKFGKYFKNSVILIIGELFVCIVVNGLAGYVLSRVKPYGSGLVDTLIFWTMMLPGISMVPLYMTFVEMPIFKVNLTGTFLPMFMMAGTNAFDIFLFRNFFNGIPMSYIEAARLDGCSNFGVFCRIIMPLSKPVISVVSISCILSAWSNFLWPYLILGRSTDKYPVSVLLYQLKEGTNINLLDNEYMMILMLSIIPMIIIYAFLSKQIMGGLNMSGIKG